MLISFCPIRGLNLLYILMFVSFFIVNSTCAHGKEPFIHSLFHTCILDFVIPFKAMITWFLNVDTRPTGNTFS